MKHKMVRNWCIKKLGEVCISDLGKTLNQSKDEGEMYPYLCAINVLWDKIDLSTLKQTRFRVEELEKYSVRKGDLLICEGGDIGRAAIWDKDETILYQNALHRVRFNDEVLPRYCLFYLRHLKENGILDIRYGKGVTIKHLVKSSLLSIPIPIPPLSEQSRIVEELDQLSNIIEKKRQQLSELDNLAQSIFYDMFGDPVTNEKGWEVKKLGEVCIIERGGSPRPISAFITNEDNGVNWIKIGDAEEGSMYINSTKEKIKPEGVKKSRMVHKGDFILSNSMSFGKPYILGVDGCIHDGWLVIRDINRVFDKSYLYYYLGSKFIYNEFKRLAVGGVVNNLNSELVRGVLVAIPPLNLQQLFAQKIEAIEKEKELIKQSIKETEILYLSRMNFYFK